MKWQVANAATSDLIQWSNFHYLGPTSALDGWSRTGSSGGGELSQWREWWRNSEFSRPQSSEWTQVDGTRLCRSVSGDFFLNNSFWRKMWRVTVHKYFCCVGSFMWGDIAHNAFDSMILILQSRLSLFHPECFSSFCLATKASRNFPNVSTTARERERALLLLEEPTRSPGMRRKPDRVKELEAWMSRRVFCRG